MSKVCGQCNLTVDDNVAFCPGCGAQLPVAETTVQQSTTNNTPIVNTEAAKAKANEIAGQAKEKGTAFVQKLKTDKKTQFICGGVIVAIIVLIVLFNVVFPSSTSVLKGYMKAYQKLDAKKVIKYYNPEYIKYIEDESSFFKYLDVDTYEEYLEESYDKLKDNDFKIISYEIDKDYKALSKSKIEDIADNLEDEYDISAKKVKNVRKYSVKIKTETDGDKDTDKESIYLIKIGMKWYVFSSITE